MLNRMLPKEPAMKMLVVGILCLFVVFAAAPLASHALKQAFLYPSRSGYQAVFLTNGQVYFGTVSNEDDRNLVLQNIYYVQLKNGSTNESDASLVKLGSEFHGPEDRMEINRNQILFIEPLKADGKVAKAIESARASANNVK